MFQSGGLGLRVRSPDGHVVLLIPLYLTGMFSLFLFPNPLFPLAIDLLTTLLLFQLKMSAPLFSQYVDVLMADRPILNAPLQLVGFYLYDLFGKSSSRWTIFNAR